ncbi:MAG: Eco57I restriction-modification methylase domain-containing protein [Deltaproteobacteria bacterium]|nr:Eco57I restriction-modification methylase domain-containing protein [Deltaproteobacteria bacterium]
MQNSLDARKTIDERRKLGQFATPTLLAREIAAFGLAHMETPRNVRFLDPAFGTGAFYSALLAETSLADIAQAAAVEIDPAFSDAASELWADFGLNVVNDDFTAIEPSGKYNLIICNPPYVRHHLIDAEKKRRVKERTKQASGVDLSGLAGLYGHFLLQSIQWMDEGAVAGWLIPSEFMDVNYGKAIKRFLLNDVELFRVHRFNPDDVQFEDALVSSTVVWFRKKKPDVRSVAFAYGGSLLAPQINKSISVDALRKEAKWTRFPCRSQRVGKATTPKLKDYFDVKRGIATGGNDFFIMDEERIHKLGLPFELFRPILPSARYVKETEIQSDEFGNPLLERRLFLLDCRFEENEVREKHPLLWNYLESGRESVAKGYLCKTRKCWWFQERRQAPMLVCTYMGRRKGENGRAFRFILNNSRATVANSYLALYPRHPLSEAIAHEPTLKRTIWEMLNGMSPDDLHDEGRVYGGGLQKIEPNELLNVSAGFLENLVAQLSEAMHRF